MKFGLSSSHCRFVKMPDYCNLGSSLLLFTPVESPQRLTLLQSNVYKHLHENISQAVSVPIAGYGLSRLWLTRREGLKFLQFLHINSGPKATRVGSFLQITMLSSLFVFFSSVCTSGPPTIQLYFLAVFIFQTMHVFSF